MNSKQIEKMTDLLLIKRANNLKHILDIKHRLQTIAVVGGVEYINDSKSTSVMSTAYSLQCMKDGVMWIVDSHRLVQDYQSLIDCVHTKVKKILAIGHQAEDLLSIFPKVEGEVFGSLEEACQAIKKLDKSDSVNTVLFSPACPTDDRYANYKVRGEAFNTLVGE
ncbi:MAG: UDP-N-acetylmuramoylalanine--D-glutamate ligase [Patiriisocius sp.]|jgi:UDP-N-acetylmuramoylalanine--D-glutamate ligase